MTFPRAAVSRPNTPRPTEAFVAHRIFVPAKHPAVGPVRRWCARCAVGACLIAEYWRRLLRPAPSPASPLVGTPARRRAEDGRGSQ